MKLCCCCFFLSVDAKLFRFFSSRFRMIAIKITTKKWRSEFDRSWRNKKLERTNRTWRILNKWSGPTEGNFILWERKTIITLWGLTTGMLPVCNHSRIEFARCTKSVIFAYLKRVRVKMSYRSFGNSRWNPQFYYQWPWLVVIVTLIVPCNSPCRERSLNRGEKEEIPRN